MNYVSYKQDLNSSYLIYGSHYSLADLRNQEEYFDKNKSVLSVNVIILHVMSTAQNPPISL